MPPTRRRSTRRSSLVLTLAVALGAAAVVPTPAMQPAAAQEGGRDRLVSRGDGRSSLVPGAADAADAASGFEAVWPRERREPIADDPDELAKGCYALFVDGHGFVERVEGDLVATGAHHDTAEPFHLEPTAPGRYLLWGSEGDVLGAPLGLVGDVVDEVEGRTLGGVASGLTRGATSDLTGELASGPVGDATGRGAFVSAVDQPSELTEWTVVDAGPERFVLELDAADAVVTFGDDGRGLLADAGDPSAAVVTFAITGGCAPFPDAEVNVDGPILQGATPYGEVTGYLDAHLHGQAFEFLGGRARCGRPWHPYGVTFALVGCPEHEDTGGRTHVLEAALSGRDPIEGHDTTGWPTFEQWPEHWSLTYEQTYHRWLERAWRSGLRMYVNLLVDNNVLCDVYPFTRNSCNEMDAVRLQAERMRELEAYVDAQHGGPGRGWLRVVTDPFEARRVMNEGKLAVVLGIEVSVLFDCSTTRGVPECDEDQIDQQIAEVYDLGVRQMELVNKFDNALSGVAGDAGETGVLVNGANVLETGSFWRMETCDDAVDHATDRSQINLADDAGLPDELVGRDALAGAVLNAVGRAGLAPAYAGGPHCNALGLSDLGVHTLHRMVERGMLFDPDHMSAKGRDEAMEVMEDLGYSGVVSSHSWSDAGIYERIQRLGGVVTPMAGSSRGFVEEWRRQRGFADDRFYFGMGFGSDVNGFAMQGGPRGADVDDPVTYPFRGLGGVVIDRQVSGDRVFDVNVDGVAHYGLYPDWIEDLRQLAGEEIVRDLERGAEAYLQTWERAVGVAPDACRPDVAELTDARLAEVHRGATPEQVLITLGQPRQRAGDVFVYCLTDGRVAHLTFDSSGRLAGTERGGAPSAGPAAPGAPATPGFVADQPAPAATGAAHTHDDEVGGAGRGGVSAGPGGPSAVGGAADHDHGSDRDRAHLAAELAVAGQDRTGALTVALLLLGLAAVAVQRAVRRSVVGR